MDGSYEPALPALAASHAAAVGLVLLFLSQSAGAQTGAPRRSSGTEGTRVDLTQVDGERVYRLDDALGLVVYDVSAPRFPRVSGRLSFTGSSFGLAVRDQVATVVMRWTERSSGAGSSTGPAAVLTLDLQDPSRPTLVVEETLAGDVLDARATASTLYVLSASSHSDDSQTTVTAFGLGDPHARSRSLTCPGTNGSLRIADGRIVLAYDAVEGGSRVVVVGDDGAALTASAPLSLPVTLGREDIDVSERLSVVDAAHIRVLGCASTACGKGDSLRVSTIDATDPAHLHIVTSRTFTAPSALFAARFGERQLYVSPRGWSYRGADSSTVQVIDLDSPQAGVRRVDLPRMVAWNLVPATDDALWVLGTRGEADLSREQVVLDALRVNGTGKPAVFAAEAMGEGWAWSPALITRAALSVCDGRLALPIRQWEPGRFRSAVVVIDATSFKKLEEVNVSSPIERVVCAHDRLFAVTAGGFEPVVTGPPRLGEDAPSLHMTRPEARDEKP